MSFTLTQSCTLRMIRKIEGKIKCSENSLYTPFGTGTPPVDLPDHAVVLNWGKNTMEFTQGNWMPLLSGIMDDDCSANCCSFVGNYFSVRGYTFHVYEYLANDDTLMCIVYMLKKN